MPTPAPAPLTPVQLRAARDVVLAAVTGGHQAAREALAALPAGDLVDVAAALAVFAGRPDVVVLTVEEWTVARAALGGGPP